MHQDGHPENATEEDMNFYGCDNLHNFTGYTYDETLDLHFAQNRFYDSDTKRFTQEDPIKDGTNWYGYVANNPLMFVDWLGLFMTHTKLKEGDIGADILAINQYLRELGILEVDAYMHSNRYWPETTVAVREFQAKNYPLNPTGVVDSYTWIAMGGDVKGSGVFLDGNKVNVLDKQTYPQKNYALISDLLKVYGGGLITSPDYGGRSIYYQTTLSDGENQYDVNFQVITNGAQINKLEISGDDKRSIMDFSQFKKVDGQYYIDAEYFQKFMCKNLGYSKELSLKEPEDGFNFIGFGLQLECSFLFGAGDIEIVHFTDRDIAPNPSITIYLYGGYGPSVDLHGFLDQITKNPSATLDSGGGKYKNFSFSASIFAIFGNEDFREPSDYEGKFKGVSASVKNVKGYVAWGDTAIIAGIGVTTDKLSASFVETDYTMIVNEDLPPIDFSSLLLATEAKSRIIPKPE